MQKGMVFVVLILMMVSAWSCESPPPLEVYGTLPDFALEDEKKEPLGSEQLRGKAWVANFLFTSCPTQ